MYSCFPEIPSLVVISACLSFSQTAIFIPHNSAFGQNVYSVHRTQTLNIHFKDGHCTYKL